MANITPIPPRASPVMDGDQMTLPWYLFFQSLQSAVNNLQGGIDATVVTAPLASGGSEGSMTFENGVLTAQTPATS